MNTLTKDARTLVDGIVEYLKKDMGDDAAVPKVKKLLTKASNNKNEQDVARISSAIPLGDKEKNQVTSMLSKRTGRDITAEFVVDETLLGGMRITIGSLVIDTSLKDQLDQMGKSIMG